VSLALMPNVPLRVVRTGQLTHWKGCAAPHAAAMAMWAARLARAGMTAPMDPFHGVDGLERLTGPFDLASIGDPIEGRSAIERCLIKHYPSELSSQAPIETMLRMRDRVLDSEIDAIEVETYHLAWHEIGGGQDDAEAKWNPTTRETADHSLPYLLAVALVDGEVTPRSFTAERIADPALRPVMQKVTIGPDDDLERRFRSGRQEMVVRMRIRLGSGAVIADEADFPRGHHMNPMSDAELDAKFMSMAPDVLPEGEAGRMLHLVRQLGEQDTLNELTGLLRQWRGRTTAASPLAQAGADHVRP
jgi:2-methylcitrate dehydratase